MSRTRRSPSAPAVRRILAYVRVSTEKQADAGHSLEAQRAKVAAYCALHDAELVEIHEDAGLSASSLERPALQAALQALQTGRADALLVVKLDRLTRSTRDLGELLTRSTREGWAILSVSESLDTATAAGRLVVSVLGAVAQWEREAIGERTSAAMQAMKAANRYTGGPVPFGFALCGALLVEAPAEQATIRAAREMRAAGLSLRAIGERLVVLGHLPRTGTTWIPATVSRMVS
jgi:site-specific DNA recombinase